jgi:hypothetical protein
MAITDASCRRLRVKLFEIEPCSKEARPNITDIIVRLMASAIHFDNNQIVFMILYTEQRGVKPRAGCSITWLFALSYF